MQDGVQAPVSQSPQPPKHQWLSMWTICSVCGTAPVSEGVTTPLFPQTNRLTVAWSVLQDGQICRSSILALAIKYAEQLQTHLGHVLDSLEELWELAHSSGHYSVRVCFPILSACLASLCLALSGDVGRLVLSVVCFVCLCLSVQCLCCVSLFSLCHYCVLSACVYLFSFCAMSELSLFSLSALCTCVRLL